MKTTVLGRKCVLQAYIYIYIYCKNLKTMFRNQGRLSHEARPPTGTRMPYAFCGSNFSLLQGFQNSPVDHSSSCLWAQGCFCSRAWGIPFSAEIKMREDLPTLGHTYFGLMLDWQGILLLFSQFLASFLMENISISYFLNMSRCT